MFVGNYHYDFIFNPKTEDVFFLELNGRFGASTAKVCACGYNEPLLALQAYEEKINYTPQIINRCVVSSKKSLLKYLCYAISNKLGPLDYPWQSIWVRVFVTLWGLISWKDDIFCLRDIKGTYSLYFSTLRKTFKALIALKVPD